MICEQLLTKTEERSGSRKAPGVIKNAVPGIFCLAHAVENTLFKFLLSLCGVTALGLQQQSTKFASKANKYAVEKELCFNSSTAQGNAALP